MFSISIQVSYCKVAALAGWEDCLHAPHASVFQHHLDAVGMGWALREDTHDNALGLQTGGLVLLLDYTHSLAGAYFTSIGYCHNDLSLKDGKPYQAIPFLPFR